MKGKMIAEEDFYDVNNRNILTHWQKTIELIRVLDGSLKCLINGEENILSENDVCIIHPNQLHRIYCEPDQNCRFQTMTINPAIFTADKHIYETYILPVLNNAALSHVIIEGSHLFTKELVHLLEEIDELETQQPPAFELSIVAYTYMMFQKLYLYYRNLPSRSKVHITTDELLYRQMADYIYQNYMQKISLDDIADSCHISRNKCCSLFKKYAQNSPIDFLNLYRLEMSTDLLKNSDESILSIALACGFGQQSYYNRLFLRKYGITPKQYRHLMETGVA